MSVSINAHGVLTWDTNGATAGTGGSGTWNTTTATNWFNGSTFQAWNNASPQLGIFGGTAGTASLNASITATAGLQFDTAGYLVSGNTVTLGGTVTANADATIGSAITGSGYTKAGAGVLTVNGTGSTTGDININAGTLKVTIASGLGNTLGQTNVASGATLELSSVNIASEQMNLNGTGVGGTAGALHPTGSVMTWSGAIQLQTNSTIRSDAVFRHDGALSGTGNLTISGTSALTPNNDNSAWLGNITLDGGWVNVPNSGSLGGGTTLAFTANGGQVQTALSFNLSKAITLGGSDCIFNANSLVNTTLSGVISGAGTLRKIGNGTFTITNNNTPANIAAVFGTLAQTSGTTAATSLSVGPSGNGTFALSGTGILNTTFDRVGDNGVGNLNVSGGTHTVTGAASPMQVGTLASSTGTINLTGGALNVAHDSLASDAEVIALNGHGSFFQSGGTHSVTGAHGNVIVGYANGSVGQLQVGNGTFTCDALDIARDSGAQGTVSLLTGGIVQLADSPLQVALNSGATGTVSLNGGSQISAPGFYVGGTNSAAGGSGNFNVQGGTATTTGTTRVWDTAGSGILLQSGTLSTGNLTTSGNPARFNWTGGTLAITSVLGFDIGGTSPLGTSVTIGTGKTLNVTRNTAIASGASLAVTGAGSFSTGSLSGAGALSSTSPIISIGSDNASPTFTGTITGNGTLSKSGSGKQTVRNIGIFSLAIHGGTIAVAPSGGVAASTSVVNVLAIDGTGKLDLTDNKIIIKNAAAASSWNGTAYVGVEGLVQSGYNGGAQNGVGIITSQSSAISPQVLTAIVTMSAAEAGYAGVFFSGQTVTSADQLVMYSWGGDANMDGTLNGDDYFQIDSAIGAAGTIFGYHNGDFNYDGDLNGDDYFIIDSNINVGQNATPFPTSAQVPAVTPVPEPAIGVFSAFATVFAARRRRARINPSNIAP